MRRKDGKKCCNELIRDTWEVRLNIKTWQKILQISEKTNLPYTSITRYCLFRYLRKLNRNKNIEIHNTRETTRSTHRHVMCFYGHDLEYAKIIMMQKGVSFSCLLREALKRYLKSFIRIKFLRAAFLQFGIKIFKNAIFSLQKPNLHLVKYISFLQNEYIPIGNHIRLS